MKSHICDADFVGFVADCEEMLEEWYAEDNGRRESVADGDVLEVGAVARVGWGASFAVKCPIDAVAIDKRERTRSRGYVEPDHTIKPEVLWY